MQFQEGYLRKVIREYGKRKVQPGQGIKINHIYYWSNAFRDPEIERSTVEVRYEPFDASVAYALVRGQWVKCVSANLSKPNTENLKFYEKW